MNQKPHYKLTADGPVLTTDGLSNVVSGLGTRADKRSHNRFSFNTNSYDFNQLEAAYSENWIARQIVQVPIDDGLREWRDWQCEEAQKLREAEKALKVREVFKNGQYWARLYGGAVVLMITDQPLEEELNIDAIKKGSLKRLVVLDRWEVQPQEVNFTDPIQADYLDPLYYNVRGGTARIHHSHMIRIDGENIPRRLRALNDTWGDSRLRQCLEDLKDVTSVKSGVATLVQEANVDVITRDGLSDELASDQEGEVIKRYALAAQMKSLVNQLLLDGTEAYDRKQISFSGLGEIMDKLMVWVSGAADIPMTRLFGMSPGGLNSTGEGDLSNYYDSVTSAQETKYRPQLEQLDKVLIRSALGAVPDDCEWEWKPLKQESGTELAQQELADAQAAEIRMGQGLKKSHVLMKMKNDGRYAITDEQIQEQQAIEEAEAAMDSFEPEEDDAFGLTE